MKKSFDEIFADVEFLVQNYTAEFRTMTILPRLEMVRKKNPEYAYDPEDLLIRESLMEHVGMLPVLAAYFYPYMDEPIDLGRSLTMLAIHDIGELVTGDEIMFNKTKESEEAEVKAALKLLDPSHHDIYREFDARETNDAKFARTIDKLAPDIWEVMTDTDISLIRLKHFADMDPDDIIPIVTKAKKPYVEWNAFFTEFHAYLMDKMADKIKSHQQKTTASD